MKHKNLLLSALLVSSSAIALIAPAQAQQSLDPFVADPYLTGKVRIIAQEISYNCYTVKDRNNCINLEKLKTELLSICRNQSPIACSLKTYTDVIANMAQSEERYKHLFEP